MSSKNTFSEKMIKRAKEKTPGRGWHSSAYHKHFEDYAEYERTDGKGRTRIQRVYVGTWYIQELSRGRAILVRALLGALWCAAAVLFVLASSRNVPANSRWFTAAAQFVGVLLMTWTLTGMANYFTVGTKMTVGDLNCGVKRFRRGCVYSAAVLWLLTSDYALCAFLIEEGIAAHLLCAGISAAAALALLLAWRLDANIPVREEKSSPESAPADAVQIE